MSIKVTKICDEGYAEEGQDNPIRWKILKSQSDDTFAQVSGWIKCKDFFNDYVYSYNTRKGFTIYGYNGLKMVEEKGKDLWFQLKGLSKSFEHNLNLVLNPWLMDQGLPPLTLLQNEFLCFPKVYLENTMYISLLSLIVRVINTDNQFKNFEEVKAGNHLTGGDAAKWKRVVTKGTFFKLPENLHKFIWYASKTHNSETIQEGNYSLSSLVHNNGVLSWQGQF